MPPRSSEKYSSSIELYLSQIGQYELLTAEQEVELAICIEEGKESQAYLERLNGSGNEDQINQLQSKVEAGKEARELFINSNLRLVVSIAKRYANKTKSLELLDIIQEGNNGLQRAVDKFDYRKGFKFSTYSTWWVRQAISRSIANFDYTVRLPVQLADIVVTIDGIQKTFEKREGRQATLQEIAQESGVDISKVEFIERVVKPIRAMGSLNATIDEDGFEFGELQADVNTDVEQESIENAMGTFGEFEPYMYVLNKVELQVILLRYGMDRKFTLGEIAQKLNFTREKAKKIEGEALAKIKLLAQPYLESAS